MKIQFKNKTIYVNGYRSTKRMLAFYLMSACYDKFAHLYIYCDDYTVADFKYILEQFYLKFGNKFFDIIK